MFSKRFRAHNKRMITAMFGSALWLVESEQLMNSESSQDTDHNLLKILFRILSEFCSESS